MLVRIPQLYVLINALFGIPIKTFKNQKKKHIFSDTFESLGNRAVVDPTKFFQKLLTNLYENISSKETKIGCKLSCEMKVTYGAFSESRETYIPRLAPGIFIFYWLTNTT